MKDNDAKIPGVLYGRYPGDSYAGGNPWQLLSASLAELYYQCATAALQLGADYTMEAHEHNEWKSLLGLPEVTTA